MDRCEFHSDACGGPGRLNDHRRTRLYDGRLWGPDGHAAVKFCFHHHMLADHGLDVTFVDGEAHYVDAERIVG